MAPNQTDTPAERVLTIPEFCRRAAISRRYFDVLRQRGEAPATVSIGRKRGVLESTASKWLRSREEA